LTDRLAELDARARVVEAQAQALLDDAEGHGGDSGALHREGRLGARARRRVLGLADQPVAADAHVLEKELAGRGRVHAHLAHRPGLREAGHAAAEDEAQHLAALRAWSVRWLASAHRRVHP